MASSYDLKSFFFLMRSEMSHGREMSRVTTGWKLIHPFVTEVWDSGGKQRRIDFVLFQTIIVRNDHVFKLNQRTFALLIFILANK